VVWSACGKVLCLWSVNSGTFLGKIGHDKELEGDGGSNAGDGAWEEPAPRSSIAEDIGKLRIHSAKVRCDPDHNHNPNLNRKQTLPWLTRIVHLFPVFFTADERPNLALMLTAMP